MGVLLKQHARQLHIIQIKKRHAAAVHTPSNAANSAIVKNVPSFFPDIALGAGNHCVLDAVA